ncbi:sulfatase-like hydrolase/transferase [Erythrobacter westpacificensis]|uniref:Sulfatase-like hydrolase/transferase n=1 Tax=Erythrobacter westpacificensis TaxID=1055231 RepID=A0ABP9KJJ4_9SPHN
MCPKQGRAATLFDKRYLYRLFTKISYSLRAANGGSILPANSAILRDFPARWFLFWLVIPNAAFMLMWFVGGPPMVPVFALWAVIAIVAAQLPWTWPKRLILAGLICYAAFYYVCVLFNLDIGKFDSLLPFLLEIQPFRSPEYIVAFAVFVATAGLALAKAPHVRRFASPMSYCLAVLGTMGLLTADYIATKDTRSTYSRVPPEGAQFTSASTLASIMRPDESGRHLVIVMVEGWGVPVGETEEAIFQRAWNRPEWRDRYEVTHGAVPFYGSTTSGELRELCGRYAAYSHVGQFAEDCLPARYRKAGYETSAYHGFSRNFFSREQWYPQIGFDEFAFRDDLAGRGVSHCDGVFAGACDREVPALITQRLKHADAPQLVYFLTLNTHLPIKDDPALGTDDCRLGGHAWASANPQLCRLFLLQGQLADALDAMAMDPDLPPTDVLVVGDHFPPFFDRNDRSRFQPGVVPWLFLSSRDRSPTVIAGADDPEAES